MLAAVIAVAAGASLLLSGGDDPQSPEEAVRHYYETIAKNGPGSADALLAPEERQDPARAQLGFTSSLDAMLEPGKPAPISGLTVQLLHRQQGWATVRAIGTVATVKGPRKFDELVYVQQSGDDWLLTTEAALTRTFATPGAIASSGNGLGVLVPQRPKEGEPAPDFALADARDGTVRKLSDFRGTPVVLNWYASWCGPCRQEIPDFQQAYASYNGGLVILGVDFQETKEKATSILDSFSATYPALLDRAGDVGDHYRVGGLPATFFIDKDGILRRAHIGRVDEDALVAGLASVGLTYTPQ